MLPLAKRGLLVVVALHLSACAVVTVAGAVVGTAVSVAGTVVSTTVDVAGAAVRGTANLVSGGSSADEAKKK